MFAKTRVASIGENSWVKLSENEGSAEKPNGTNDWMKKWDWC